MFSRTALSSVRLRSTLVQSPPTRLAVVCLVTSFWLWATEHLTIGVDLVGILRRTHMVNTEGGSVPNGVGYGEGWPLSSRLGGLGSVVSSPSGVRAENGFWRILKATERSFLYLYDKNLRGGQFALASPLLQIPGGLVRRIPPWSTPVHLTQGRGSGRVSVAGGYAVTITCAWWDM